jgi:hypothetical protein
VIAIAIAIPIATGYPDLIIYSPKLAVIQDSDVDAAPRG